MSDDWTLMSHESHGFCFCGKVHCGNLANCDSSADHEPADASPAQTHHQGTYNGYTLADENGNYDGVPKYREGTATATKEIE